MRIQLLILFLFLFSFTNAQLDHRMSPEEYNQLPAYNALRAGNINTANSVLPPSSAVRTIAEWEELQGFTVTWTSYTTMLREIVRAAKQECRVYVIVNSAGQQTSAINFLAAGGVDTVNVSFVIQPYNSVWSRDYGMWSAYTNDVDSLITIDWIYNRPRPLDDVCHLAIANLLGTPIYQTTTAPWDLVHTGGNFMTDGFGTGFSSKLILNDNTLAAGFGVQHTAAEIDTIMKRFMGIDRYIKMNTLPYDQIHHIDMHMKLLDEETLIIGQYPTGVADGPQIEANLQFILANYYSVYGTPYKVIRIPMPADNGQYPPTNGADYFTYTNASFINKTLIVPTYNIASDSTALRIYRDALPGYTVVGINSTASIGALGALHCITKEIGTSDPLLISHQALADTYDTTNAYSVAARMQHRSGIQTATLYYRTDTTQPYISFAMNSLSSQINYWGAQIPAQLAGTTVYYYVQAQATSGKQQVRPMSAPTGYWKFKVLQTVGVHENNASVIEIHSAYPNPSKGITCIPFSSALTTNISANLFDSFGRNIKEIFAGTLQKGEHNFFIDTADLPSGVYQISIRTNENIYLQKLIVR